MFRYVCRATACAMLFIFVVVVNISTPLAHAAEMFPPQTILTPPNGGNPSLFGSTVAYDGNTALVSAPGHNGRRGGVYVYVRTQGQWTQQALLTPDQSAPTGVFYQSLAISGDTVLVGRSELDSGLVYVYVRSGTQWTQQAVLRPEDDSANRGFGERLSIAGDTAYIAVSRKKPSISTCGPAQRGSVRAAFRRTHLWTGLGWLLP